MKKVGIKLVVFLVVVGLISFAINTLSVPFTNQLAVSQLSNDDFNYQLIGTWTYVKSLVPIGYVVIFVSMFFKDLKKLFKKIIN